MLRLTLVIVAASFVAACGFTITSTPKNANTCAVGAIYGCDNSNKALPPASDAPETLSNPTP